MRVKRFDADPAPSRGLRRWTAKLNVDDSYDEVVVPANATLERDVSFPNESWGGRRLFLHVFEGGGEPKPVPWYLDATQQTEPFVYQLTEAKGLRAHYPWALLRVTPDRQTYALGETANLSVSVENRITVGWEGTLRVTHRVVTRSRSSRSGFV